MPAEAGVRVCADPRAAAAAAGEVFRSEVEEAIGVRGRAAVALPGGETPRLLFERLGGPAFARWAGWRALDLFWTDERAVSADSPHSNYRLARETFLDRAPIGRDRVHRMRGEAADLEAEAERYTLLLTAWSRGGPPCLDLVVLGLGPDGHTASLFPGGSALVERERWVVAAAGPPPLSRRLTLTLPVLDAARAVLFLVTGEDKAEIVRRVLEGSDTPDRVPARGVRPAGGRVHWVLDGAAGARLGPAAGRPRAG